MSDVNLLNVLNNRRGYSRVALKDIVVFGRVRCLIEKPGIIENAFRDGNGYYALLDAYALKCLGDDYFQNEAGYDVNRLYFTRGSLLIYVDSKKWVGKDVKVYSRFTGRGVTIRRQEVRKRNETKSSLGEEESKTTGISAFAFMPNPITGPDGKLVFTVACNKLVELGLADSDVKGTALEDFMVKVYASSNKEIPYSKTLEGFVPYSGAIDYKELVLEDDNKADRFEGYNSSDDNKKIDVSKINMNLVYHLEGQDISPFYESFKDDIEAMSKRRYMYLKDEIRDMEDELGTSSAAIARKLREDFISKVARNYHTPVGVSNVKNSVFINNFIEQLSSCVFQSNEEEDSQAETKGIETLKGMIQADQSVLWGSTGTEIDMIPAISDDTAFAINVLSTCTGIGINSFYSSFMSLMYSCNVSIGLWFLMLMNYPYFLGFASAGLNLVDCDVLYYGITKKYGQGVSSKNAKHRKYLALLATMEKLGEKETFISRGAVKVANSVYPRIASRYLGDFSFPARLEIREVLKELCSKNVEIDNNDKQTITSARVYSNSLYEELESIGVLNSIQDNYIALEHEIEEEFMIYDVFEKMGKRPTGITDEMIENAIREYESEHGFKLESLQKEAIKLCKLSAGVLSGCAGSGKTTTSECMTNVLKNLEGYKIVYCTPTGKACRRLAEVVHSTVSTIHSTFRVGLVGMSYLSPVSKKKKDDGKRIFIFDEMAMCSSELMYHVARNMGENDIAYFLGDVKQLPPIGKGCPFKVLMTLLPCVELGVSKRAAEGSLVNYNTSLVNFVSSGRLQELLYDDNSFMCNQCDDQSIPNTVRSVWDGFMKGSINGAKYKEDDIQVITGYQKPDISFSVGSLNPLLQDLLRGKDKLAFHIPNSDRKFYINDRVINTKNNYSFCRYIINGGKFKPIITFGVVNGDVGKIIGVVRSDQVQFSEYSSSDYVAGEGLCNKLSEEEVEQLKDKRSSYEDGLRDDSSLNDDRSHFVVVRVYDTDLQTEVYVLYRAKGKIIDGDLVLVGPDLGNLDLAYALTTHKMQGSQSPVVILPFGSQGSPYFINRNMINTMITRSQGIVYCIGSVKGEDSLINQGRRQVSKTESKDLLSVLIGESDWLFKS